MTRTKNLSPLAMRLDDYINKSHASLKDISKKAKIPEFTLLRFTIGSGLLAEDYAIRLIDTLNELEATLPQERLNTEV